MNDNSLTLSPHVMKLCRLTQKTYQADARQMKTANIVSVAKIASTPSYRFAKDNVGKNNAVEIDMSVK